MKNDDKDFLVSAMFILSNLLMWVIASAFKSATLVYVAVGFCAVTLPLFGFILCMLHKEEGKENER